MRSAALIAEDIAARGGGVAGYLWDDGLEDALCALDEIRNLIKNRKTVSVEKIKEALSES